MILKFIKSIVPLLLLSLACLSQTPNYNLTNSNERTTFGYQGPLTSNGYQVKNFADTFVLNAQPYLKGIPGLLVRVGNQLYYRNEQLTGWIPISFTDIPSNFDFVDSMVVYSNNTICQWKKGSPTCYTLSTGGTNIFTGIDSITANLRSICEWKNGIPNCHTLLAPGIDSVTLTADTLLCQWSSGIPGCYIIHGNVVQTGPTDSLKVTGNNYCWYFSGVPTCITINNVGKYYDATSLNFDSTKYIHYNNGVPIDSITTLIKPVIGDTCILIRDSSNGKTYFYLNPNCRSGGGGTLQQAFDAAPTANPQINAHNNAFIIDSSAYFIINTYDGIYGVSSIELAGSQSSIFSTTATGTSENVVDGGSSRLSFTNQSLSKSNMLALDSAKTVFYNLDSTARLGVNTSNPLAATHIVGNGTDPVLLAMNGNVGIGTTTPTAKTHIVAPDSNVLKLEGLINTPLLTDSMLVIGLDGNVKKAAKSASSGGTVTSVTSVDANATVANTTTTPVITIVSAPKWLTGRTLSITGDIAYTSPSFDGSGNVTAAGTLATVNTNVGSFGSATQVGTFTVNGKGLITAASNTSITIDTGAVSNFGVKVRSLFTAGSNISITAGVIAADTSTGVFKLATQGFVSRSYLPIANPSATGSLTLTSTTNGFKNASLTTTQMNAVSSPTDGEQIWNTTEKALFTYNPDWGWESNDFAWVTRNMLAYRNDFTSTLAVPAVTDGMLTYTGTLASNPVNTYTGHPGIVSLSTSTSSTGATSLGTGNGTTTQPILLGGGRLLYEVDVNVPTLSTSGERFTFISGLSSTNNTNAVSDGYVFLYDEGGIINSTAATPNWKTMNGNGSSITANNTGIVVTAGQWYRLSIIVNAANTSASYYIDGSLVVTETLTRPTAAMGIVNRIQKSVGTTARTVTIDYVQLKQRFTTAR